jgi:integration host factor subunit beta
LNAFFGRILKMLPYPSEQMNRSDLVQLLSDRFSQLTQGDAETAVSTILEAMNSAMVRGHRIEIRDFGSFSVIHRASRMGRNPRSGAPVESPAARVPHFKPGKALREAVDLPADEVAPAQRQAK